MQNLNGKNGNNLTKKKGRRVRLFAFSSFSIRYEN